MPGVGVDLGGSSLFHEPSRQDDNDPVADLSGDPQVMGDEQHREAVGLSDFVKEIENLCLG